MYNKIEMPKFSELRDKISNYAEKLSNPKLREMFKKCFFNTLDTTVEFWDDNTTYVVTGDIDAMWLRDSSAQVMQYLKFANLDKDIKLLIKGLIERQIKFIKMDPYANSFGKKIKGNFPDDLCEKIDYVWERKFELDSLCYPIWLALEYFSETNDDSIFTKNFLEMIDIVMNVFLTEQDHKNLSKYYHYRPNENPSLSVPNKGYGSDVLKCGLVWSGYRPSDDPCEYGYFIPGNMLISVIMGRLSKLPLFSEEKVNSFLKLKSDIDLAIEKYAIVEHPVFGKMYAYEIDGLGNVNLMDDANIPSLLSIPYFGYANYDDEIYQATRKFILSSENKYFYSGKALEGIGSAHTPKGYVWDLSLIMQCLTSKDQQEIDRIIDMLIHNDNDTLLMHEGVYMDDSSIYTREWFAWANSLFSLMILEKSKI